MRLVSMVRRMTCLETPMYRQKRELVPELGDYVIVHHVHAEHEVDCVQEPSNDERRTALT